MKSEDRIQHEIVMWFSQEHPQFNGALFEIYNNPVNQKHALHRRAMGMVKGASDLILHVNGLMCCIEIKAPESTHKRDHIKYQLDWGKGIVSRGGYFFMSQDIELIKLFINSAIIKNTEALESMQTACIIGVEQKMINKTVKF